MRVIRFTLLVTMFDFSASLLLSFIHLTFFPADGLPHETVFRSRRHQYPTQGSFYHIEEVCGTFNGSGSCRRGEFSRDVVVRSELTSAGSTGASYPLSEIWLNSKVRGICFYAVTACAAIILFVPMLLEHPFVLMFDRYRRQAHYLVAKTWAFLTVAPLSRLMHGTDQEGASVFFFPEGTRSKDGKLGPFKKGAFSVAAKTGVPVIPITLIGTGEIMPAGMEGRLNPGSVKVIVHPSLVGNKPDALCNEARNIIAQELICQG
ncbi:UNVERIFIED_CONTAM: 1-acyl-sn-glycerol-3-phosphate acyltransferase BAT2, chloroplastic [Sesamum angustifolium]|uniref:1-acyl-sn-glycerol-3-phosphate acyltransferase BAT2, chloroplastic n=1 Tax=Sesamum angustifolium TaxID=2727405 RepID=A0AAW2MTM0_9LAMI